MRIARLLISSFGVLAVTATGIAAAETVLVEFDSPMKYIANQSDPGVGLAWTSETFDDAAWSAGVYGVGYESGTGAQNLIRTSVPGGTSSIFTRATFVIANPATVTGLTISADYDDGFVAWINGVEVYRSPEVPAGSLLWNTNATLHESSNGATPNYGPSIDVSEAALPVLHAGDNVLAIGVWNAALPSSDLVLVPRLAIGRGASVTRGPYLQKGTSTSVVVRWRTATPSESRVIYGAAPGSLTEQADDPALTTEHVVSVTGLTPDTTYYYAVGSSTQILDGDDSSYFFTTSPEPGTEKPTRIWVVGDSGTADASARAVKNAYLGYSAGSRTDLWLMLGDNAYPDGTDPQYQAAVFDMYPELLRQSVLWPTLGNHDGHTADSTTQTGPYYQVFTLPRAGEAGGEPSGTEAYYSFDYANIHFICLESYETDRSVTGPMLTWLRQDLLFTGRDWIIAFWHHPPYTKGSHDSDTEIELEEMRRNALPILEDGGVDLVLTGHSHSYERSFLLDGHYGVSSTLTSGMKIDAGDGRVGGTGPYMKPGFGPAPHAGAVYAVAGSSGQTSGGLLNHPAMYLSLNSLGSLVLDVNANRLDATFIDQNGTRRDWFSILKEVNHPPVAAAGADVQAECASPSGSTLSLDGTASSDPDSTPGSNDDVALYEWFESFGTPAERVLGTGSVLAASMSLGAHVITLRVTDRHGATGTDEVVVTVADTTPPEIQVDTVPPELWPPDHRMIRVLASVIASDACGETSIALLSVASDEPDDAPGRGDGRTTDDIQGAEIGSEDYEIRLRAERSGMGDGRTYTITYEATDRSGLATPGTARIFVPHSRAGRSGRTGE